MIVFSSIQVYIKYGFTELVAVLCVTHSKVAH